jgi:hypothetical protein
MHNVPFYCFSASPAAVAGHRFRLGNGPGILLQTPGRRLFWIVAAALSCAVRSGRPRGRRRLISSEGITSMAKIIKVRCTGKGQHENEIDLETIVGKDVVIYGNPIDTGRSVPARVVRRCDECDEGKVVVTREMIEENF